jgi:hypothetical protein
MPVAGHPKVRVQRPAVVEHNELMLSAALHPLHRRSVERSEARSRHATSE